MKDEKIRRLLLSTNEEDCQIAAAMLNKQDILEESMFAFEDVEKYSNIFKLDTVKEILTNNPNAFFGGSVGLFFHGIRLKRWKSDYHPDYDIILPFYQKLQINNFRESEIIETSGKSDFKYAGVIALPNLNPLPWNISNIKIDIRIDPLANYEIVKYDGFEYRVANLFDILEAKIKYAKKGSGKHKQDILDMTKSTIFKEYLKKQQNGKSL